MDSSDDFEHLAEQAQLHQAIHQYLTQMPLFARLYWEAFTALKTAGFTDAQAFDLVRSRGWNLSE